MALGNNRIKFLGDHLFNNLLNMKIVFLVGNKCINENFEGSNVTSVVSQATKKKCGLSRMVNESISEIETAAKEAKQLIEVIKEALISSSETLNLELKVIGLCLIFVIWFK